MNAISIEIKAFDHAFTATSGALAELTGSEKQIAWASEIRHRVISQILELETELAHPEVWGAKKGVIAEKALKVARVMRGLIEEQSASKFFIEVISNTNAKDYNLLVGALAGSPGHHREFIKRVTAQ